MKEKILKLREEGKSYKQIVKELGCSIGTVSYHCGKNQKEKTKARSSKNRLTSVICSKLDKYCRKQLQSKADDFQRERPNRYDPEKKKYIFIGKHLNKEFGYKDVINKLGDNPVCYLTGKPIDLLLPKTYAFDHIIPPSRGGNNSLENLGLSRKIANSAKSNMLVSEFVELCKEVLEFNGYEIRKRSEVGEDTRLKRAALKRVEGSAPSASA